jgi:carboxyl-terminal processing protease
MEIGEATLPNCLEADHTEKLAYRRLNRVVEHVETLVKNSNARIKDDQDFAYILEDIETLKERLKDKSVSLSETKRLAEKDEEKAKREKRKQERKLRDKAEEAVFDLTIKMIKSNTKLGEEVENEEKPIRLEEEPEEGEETEEEEDPPKLDSHMRETLHILHDYIRLLNPKEHIAAKESTNDPKIQ